jgi:thioredoxin-like negative regulator of GroEL
MGTNYEYFRHFAEAATGYQLAIEYGTSNPQVFFQCALGYTRCLVALGRADEAIQTLDQMANEIDDPRLKRLLTQLKDQVQNSAGRH